jgi:phospholipase C
VLRISAVDIGKLRWNDVVSLILVCEEAMRTDENPWSKIEHIVVVMLENRSFDNLLGWLYDPENDPPFDVVPPDFEGLSGKGCSNSDLSGKEVPASKTLNPRSPQPNPGEPFEDVYSQIYDVSALPFASVPAVPTKAATMRGFIRNYAHQRHKPIDPSTIMQSLTPHSLPVLSALAHNFALCDHWFASIPTQTFCNRSFVHAGTSSGYVNNKGAGLCFVNDTPTIFDLLEEAHRSWQVFVGGWLLQSFTLLTQESTWKYALTGHFSHFKNFLQAARRPGGLPNYSFIEPIYFDSMIWGPENDMHPECNPYEFYGPSNLHRGEALLAMIYNALRESPDWESTLMVIVFDEHGGCYDHVPPPTSATCNVAICPDGKVIAPGQPGGIGFQFDRLGPRVPAIVVSAYTAPETRLHDVFEHTSILSTIVNCFHLPNGRLGARQANADDLRGALTLTTPREAYPVIKTPQFSLFEDLKSEFRSIVHSRPAETGSTPISELQRAALHGMAQFTNSKDLHDRIGALVGELEADVLLAEHELKHFGSW